MVCIRVYSLAPFAQSPDAQSLEGEIEDRRVFSIQIDFMRRCDVSHILGYLAWSNRQSGMFPKDTRIRLD